MAEFATLARPYARAAFEAAREAGDDGLDRWSRMLAWLAAATETEALAQELSSPARSPEGKALLLTEVAGDALDDQGRKLVRVLAGNRRLALLPEIATQYEALKDEAQRTLEVEVVTARALSEAELEQLRAGLARRFAKEIALESRVDGGLLGGAVIHAGDTIIDGSIRGRLDRLADSLRVN